MVYCHTVKKLICTFLVNKIFRGTKTKNFEIKRKLLILAGNDIGEGTKIVGPIFSTHPIKIGKNCWIGKNFTVYGEGCVTIGDNCDIAPEVVVLTGGHEIGNSSRRAGKGQLYTVQIGDGVWIGARSTIGKNIKIANGSVVAASACVMNCVDEDTLVGGVPARIIRRLKSEADNE